MASPSGGDDGRLFEGVRFVLVGFDDATGSQYRSDMVGRGGVDAERLSNGCTHVVVWGLLYDDPECVLARTHGKKVVNELWVDDSLDRGVLADTDRALYWPVREFNGIPGAESLVICLTGFQKKYREDITKMVSLMGAQFSKPLVGNVVTHLICYKFEGDKYELARKVNIKLANHRWLEDCLKEWKIVPIDDYSKSTWELELMEAHAKDSEDDAEDTGQKSFNSMPRIMCTPNLRKGAETFVNPDVKAPMQSPPIIPNENKEVVVERHLNTPGHIGEAEDADINMHDSTIQGDPDSAKADLSTLMKTPSVLIAKRKNAAVRNMNSSNPIKESEEKNFGARTVDNTSDAIGTPNWSTNKLNSSKVDRGQHQEKDSLSGNLFAAVVRSNEKTNQNSGGDSMSNNINNQSNSKKVSQKSSTPKRHSDHRTVSHQKTEKSTSRTDSDNSLLEMGQQKVVEHADIQGMKSNETNRNVDAAFAQRGKNFNSPDSLKLRKEDLVSETSPSHCPFVNRLSDASETVNVSSSMGTNPAEDIAVDLEKQQSSLSTSRRSRSMKTLHKHAVPVDLGKLAEYSSCGNKNVKSLSKSRTLPKAMKKNKFTTSSSATVQDEKKSSDFSFDNVDGNNAEASASPVNQDLLHLKHETGNAHQDQAHDISEHGSRISQVVSCSGIADTTITAPVGSDNEVGAVTTMVSSDNAKEGAKRFQDASSNVQGETSHSKKVEIPTESIAGAKRPRNACMEIDGLVINTRKKPVSEPWPAEVIPCKYDDTASKNGCRTASAAEVKADSPKKVSLPRVRNTVTRKTRNALTKMDDAQVAPKESNETLVDKTETMAAGSLFEDLFPEDHVEDNQKMRSSNASATNCGTLSPKNVSTPKVRNAIAKRKMKDVERKIENKCGKVGSAIASVAKVVSLKRIKEMPHNFNKVTAEKNSEKDNKDGTRDVSGLFCQDSAAVDKPVVHNPKLRSSKCNKVLATDHEKENRQRRTEKFFAAAAAGRWILKSDYLTSCIEAGKFLDEEPFEWFGTGLSDGEKISLEAPRTWRILRQQMHHGAFYGMQIVVYGQLKLPTLDTVNRAVQAGDGTILATSPPYTRFLESGVDFAVVSASIPSADAWVQEFIRHGIPCVSADYLVEYVCKPGHPLDSHILFETNDLANKSLEKLMKNQQEVATDEEEQSEDDDDEDLNCSVCGRKDRGDVMLICGDEDGTDGCGIGMHIYCCDPPLDAVPEDDWLCPKCQVPKTKTKPTRSTARKLRPSKEM
ncbi:hypothetical protein QOZ80_3BG0282840 [Eleusine coracana subsp. coracana]|nr:hypothetical protein QOZ80_3BG0282840 [Eleusine coracana subsp. coracana]